MRGVDGQICERGERHRSPAPPYLSDSFRIAARIVRAHPPQTTVRITIMVTQVAVVIRNLPSEDLVQVGVEARLFPAPIPEPG